MLQGLLGAQPDAFLTPQPGEHWCLRRGATRNPVQVQQARSFWLGGWAGLTLKALNGGELVVWASAAANQCSEWRRLRVWFYRGLE